MRLAPVINGSAPIVRMPSSHRGFQAQDTSTSATGPGDSMSPCMNPTATLSCDANSANTSFLWPLVVILKRVKL